MGAVSVWHWAILLIAVAPVAIVIYVAISRSNHEKKTVGALSPGFIGWLYVFAAVNWAGFARLVVELGRYYGGDNSLMFRSFPLLAWSEVALNAFYVVFALAALFAMAQKSKRFLILYEIWYALGITALPVNLFGVYAFLTYRYRLPNAGQALAQDFSDSLGRWIGTAIATTAWLIYFIRSERVRATFVR